MEETAVVGKLGVEVVADTPAGPQIVEWDLVDTRDKLRVEYLIDAAAMLVQVMAFRLLRMRVTVRLGWTR